jgi:DNA ligase-1
MIYPQIFKRTQTGAVQTWCAEVDGDKFRTIAGQIDGKKTTAAWTQCEPKNVGKKNEISAADQATAEVNALYKKQLRKDYKETIADIDNITRVKPMLAKKWADEVDRFPVGQIFGYEPKLDGFRCMITKEGMFTRDGLPIVSSPHIFEDIKWVFDIHPTAEIDGELYNHDFHDDFNKISSLLKKQKPDAAHFVKTKELVQYWVYDIFFPEHADMRQSERRINLENLFPEDNAIVKTKYIVLTPRDEGPADMAADAFTKWKALNYEGAMGKPIDGKYEGKRSSNNLKIKEFIDEEFIIVDIQPGKGSRANIAARAIVQLEDGLGTSEVGIIGTHEYCRELLENKEKYISTPGTVQYLNRTPAGKLRGGKLKEVNRFM